MRLALVLWDGELGGAEVMFATLASVMRRLGVGAEVVFITYAGPLAERLRTAGVPFHTWGCQRGRDILRSPRRYAAAMQAVGPDGVLLPGREFIGGALRVGGYRARIVAVEHGNLLLAESSRPRELLKRTMILASAWADDVEVGVSDFMVAQMRRGPHAGRLYRIYNGIDPSEFAPAAAAGPAAPEGDDREIVVGFASRLIPGKGADDAITAVARACEEASLRLRIAGVGSEQPRLQALVRTLGMDDRIEFLGLVHNMQLFWQSCDVAIFPSHQFVESFGMVAVEAMACGKPVIATRNGGVPEVVVDGVTGTIVEPGDVTGLAQALIRYSLDPALRHVRGAAGRERAAERFNIYDIARAYLRCFEGQAPA
jgi:glycosyltransferase involved in cell wall biosynthesis